MTTLDLAAQALADKRAERLEKLWAKHGVESTFPRTPNPVDYEDVEIILGARGTCKNCMWWGEFPVEYPDTEWGPSRECRNPNLSAASSHCASLNHDGPPVTMPDFGCNQYERRKPTVADG